MSEHEEGPWTEAQWERFMEHSDMRSARFGELLETFMDDPDRDRIVAREMGWTWLEEALDEEERLAEHLEAVGEPLPSRDEPAADCPFPEIENPLGLDPEVDERLRKEEEALQQMPAYRRSFDFGLRAHRALQRYCTEEHLPGDPMIEAVSNSMIIAAKIAGGHAMGYGPDSLCGNIVRCRRGLEAAEQCLAAMHTLREAGEIPADVLDPLIAECGEVRTTVEHHIAHMRSQVWWDHK